MKIISIRLEKPITLGIIGSRNLPQQDFWEESYEGLEPSLRDRTARLTVDGGLMVIRRGTEERRIPLNKLEWINTVPDADDMADPAPLTVASKVVASRLALTEEEEAALATTPAVAPRRAGRFVKK